MEILSCHGHAVAEAPSISCICSNTITMCILVTSITDGGGLEALGHDCTPPPSPPLCSRLIDNSTW